MAARNFLAGLFLFLVATFLLSGCSVLPLRGDSKATKQERDKAVSYLDEIYYRYVTGTVSEARSNLLRGVEFTHENSGRIPDLQGALPMAFARLSLLERTVGNEAQSLIYYEKARYWSMVGREKLGITPEEILADHQAFTREESDSMALEWDMTFTKGVGPAYLKGF